MIYGFFAVLYGILMSVQTALCASLTENYGNWFSTVIVHLVGLLVLTPFFFSRWGQKKGHAPWYLYLGGTIGVFNVVLCNYGVVSIGMTNSNTLMLLGEIVFSAFLDRFGLFGMKKRRITLLKWLAILIMLAGCGTIALLSGEAGKILGAAAVLASLMRGVALVISRQLNGQLGLRAGTGFSTYMNYATGFVGALLIFAVLKFPMQTAFPAAAVPFWIYLGGMFGCCGIFLCNLASPRLSALTLSLLVFVSETGAGMLFDQINSRLSMPTIIGCGIVSVGMILNLFAEKEQH